MPARSLGRASSSNKTNVMAATGLTPKAQGTLGTMEVSMTLCAQCQQGPQGVEGHFNLFTQTMGGQEMQLRCRACNAVWVRRHSQGTYAWAERAVAEAGAEVPLQPVRVQGRR